MSGTQHVLITFSFYSAPFISHSYHAEKACKANQMLNVECRCSSGKCRFESSLQHNLIQFLCISFFLRGTKTLIVHALNIDLMQFLAIFLAINQYVLVIDHLLQSATVF